MAQQWKDLLFSLAGNWYFSLCPERLRQFTAHDLWRGRKSQTRVPPFPPSNNLGLWRHHTPSCWAGTIALKANSCNQGSTPSPQVSCGPHSGLSHSQDQILKITPGSGQPPLLQSSLPSPSHAHRAVPGDGWHILLLPGQRSHQHSPLMLSQYFQHQGKQEAQGCGKTKQGSLTRFLTPLSRFAPFSLKTTGHRFRSGLALSRIVSPRPQYHQQLLPSCSWHHPWTTAQGPGLWSQHLGREGAVRTHTLSLLIAEISPREAPSGA